MVSQEDIALFLKSRKQEATSTIKKHLRSIVIPDVKTWVPVEKREAILLKSLPKLVKSLETRIKDERMTFSNLEGVCKDFCGDLKETCRPPNWKVDYERCERMCNTYRELLWGIYSEWDDIEDNVRLGIIENPIEHINQWVSKYLSITLEDLDNEKQELLQIANG